MTPGKIRLAVTGSLLLAAFICYGIGSTTGFTVFIGLGVIFETVFWIRVFNRRHKRNERLEEIKTNN